VPTCQTTGADMIAISGGSFVFGGRGSPRSSLPENALVPEHRTVLAAFWIDRTEVTNAAFSVFGEMSATHGIWASAYPEALAFANAARYPRSDVDWSDARAYCRFLGKDLPSSMQWQRALRGPATPSNPMPDRNLPWGGLDLRDAAAIASTSSPSPSPAGFHPLDRSPEGVLDLEGNLQEWTRDSETGAGNTPPVQRAKLTRGRNWFDTAPNLLVDYMVIENARSPRLRNFFIGFRCVRDER
jgi:eukaryotic-like serine/threonine-protein kinase